jgi:hypothetical protein
MPTHTQGFDKLEVRRHVVEWAFSLLSFDVVLQKDRQPVPVAQHHSVSHAPTSERLLPSALGCRLSGYPGLRSEKSDVYPVRVPFHTL